MASQRQALTAWQNSLEKDIGVDQARTVVDRVDRSVGEEHLDQVLYEALDRQGELLTNRLTAAWRRDMLLVSVPQLLALIAILAGVGA